MWEMQITCLVDGRVKFNFIEDYICQSSVFRLFQTNEL
jgi:hypothetical protein